MHALIIEDEVLIAMAIENILADFGFVTFAIAESEDEAVRLAHEHCPDLITSDVRLASGCGIDAVRRIGRDRRIPTVFITASAHQVRERSCSSIIVEKPFLSSDLIAGVLLARHAVSVARAG